MREPRAVSSESGKPGNWIKSPVAAALRDLLLPPRCAFCGCLTEGESVCPDCTAALPHLRDGRIQSLNGFPGTIAFYYDGVLRDGIHALKFEKKSWRGTVFGRYIGENAAACFPAAFDAVTFVPVSLRRNFERGFDQAELLARSAAQTLGLPLIRTIRKIRHNRQQSTLTEPAQRRENVRDVYRPLSADRIRNRRFLLVDDVITTGSTVTACAAVLANAGAESVVCAALAGGHADRLGSQRENVSQNRA